MKRSEAYVNYGMDVLSINDRIDKIYNDFGSRTCENCKYSYEAGYSLYCRKGVESLPIGVSRDFGCNKFERIDHD